jgi:hypothetical protein
VKRALVTANFWPQSVNAIKTTMARDVSFGMSARQIRIVVFRENALTLVEQHCRENNAIVSSDGSAMDAIKVSFHNFNLELF